MARAAIIASVRGAGPLRRPAADAVGLAWYASRPARERLRAAHNHQRLDPRLDAAAARRLARRSYREYVRMIANSIWAEALSGADILQRVRVVGRENLAAAPSGGVLTLCHFGNWDIAASGALALGLPMTTVMAQIISPAFTWMVAVSRRSKGFELFTPQQAARGLVRALRHHRFVALMADVPEAGPTVTVRYCGGDVRFSAVPARLAAALGTPVIPVACWREDGHWVLQIHAALPVGRDDEDAAVMSRVAQVLEPPVRRHPEQWYPFHEVYDDGG